MTTPKNNTSTSKLGSDSKSVLVSVTTESQTEPHIDLKSFYVDQEPTKTLENHPMNSIISLNAPRESNIDIMLGHFGENKFEIPEPKFLPLFKEHAVAPFFLFQVFCCILWCINDSIIYSILTLVMLIIFEAILVNTRMVNLSILQEMITSPHDVWVFRDSNWVQTSSTNIVPGDFIGLPLAGHDQDPELNILPCDILLLGGKVIVNEAMLTGESIPLQKEPLAPSTWSSESNLDIENAHRIHFLHGGTKLIQSDIPELSSEVRLWKRTPFRGAVGRVVRTGFRTSQGTLIHSIIFDATKRNTGDNTEAYFILASLFSIALIVSGYVMKQGIKTQKTWPLFLNCLTILTSVVPPELPIQLSMAVNNSLQSLQKLMIFCTAPFKIPSAGSVSVCCFDKTGTLTTEDLELETIHGFIKNPYPSLQSQAKGTADDISDSSDSSESDLKPFSPHQIPSDLAFSIAGCHSLTTLNREILGDPLESTALASIGWALNNDTTFANKSWRHSGSKAPGYGSKVEIVKRFHFQSSLQRMSCLSKVITPSQVSYMVYCKGSAEKIDTLLSIECKATLATMNFNVLVEANRLSTQGYRVLALAFRPLKNWKNATKMLRKDAEKDLFFLGFLCFLCPLKKTSINVINTLQNASQKCVMITGDHPLTAAHVATSTGIIAKEHYFYLPDSSTPTNSPKWVDSATFSLPSHQIGGSTSSTSPSSQHTLSFDQGKGKSLVITGSSLSHFLSQPDASTLLPFIGVFARVTPDQKSDIVAKIQGLGNVVLMCGDGTNDVGALKQSEVGVSLLNSVSEDKSLYADYLFDENQDSNTNNDTDTGGLGAGDGSVSSIGSGSSSGAPRNSSDSSDGGNSQNGQDQPLEEKPKKKKRLPNFGRRKKNPPSPNLDGYPQKMQKKMIKKIKKMQSENTKQMLAELEKEKARFNNSWAGRTYFLVM